MYRLFRERDEQRFDLAFGVTFLLLLVLSPIAILIPLLGPVIYATICSYHAGRVGSRYVERGNGYLAAVSATIFFYISMSALVITALWWFMPVPVIDFNPLDVWAVNIISTLMFISCIFAAIGGRVGSKPTGYYSTD